MAVLQTKIKARSILERHEVDDAFESMLANASPQELEAFEAFLELPPEDMESVLSALSAEEYADECPVTIEQFLDDPYYLGESCKQLYKPWRHDLIELFSSYQYQVALVLGGLGCIKEDTLIDTEAGKIACGDITSPIRYRSWNGQSFDYRLGTAPFPKGKDDLYRVVHKQGELIASASHLILCADGVYRQVSALSSGDQVVLDSHSISDGSSSLRDSRDVCQILAIEKTAHDWYWDLQVPGTHNYVAGGFVNHNSGKSEFSSIALLRMLYEASCYKDPAVSYGLSSGSKISFCLAAPSEQVARNSAFEKIITKIQKSDYFKEKFKPSSLKDNRVFRGNELLFPKNLSIVCGSSTQMASLGANIMGGFVDELNFFQPNPKNATRTNDRYGDFEKAGKLFDSLKRRIISRFSKRGKLPGILIAASSKTTKDSLTERFIREAIQTDDASVFVRDYSIVDVKREAFSEKNFRVLVGNEYYSSRILPDDYDVTEIPDHREAIVIDVPEDLKGEFERDISGALRDLMGISTSAIHSFITKVEYLQFVKSDKTHPFLCPLYDNPMEWNSRLPYRIKWESLATMKENGEWEPREEPWAKRFVHLDPASTGDAMGLCIAHVAGLIPIRKQNEQDEMVEYLPYYKVDFVLRIKGCPGEEVLFRKVRELIYDFSLHGFSVGRVTTDKYQSREMLQILQTQGYRAEIISVDETKDSYLTLRRAIYDRRIECYDYPILFEELRKLEEGPFKIDHAANGSKDCADALAGVVFSLSEEATHAEPILPERGLSVSEDNENPEQTFVQNRDENFVPVEEHADGVLSAPIPNKYKKKSMIPGYQKITDDGKVIDLKTNNRPEQRSSYIMADYIEIG